LVNGRSDRKR